mmetsp:Transcript_25788/g.58746  ORF Transcript_25788/g.58746 Transcript_25788/m.58746 type:complete len:89 (+) Transcript_25788:82-348(+)
MLPLGRCKGTQRVAQGSGAASHVRRREVQGAQNAQDATMASEDAAMGAVEEFFDEEAGPEAEFEALLEKRVHTDYDKDFEDDFNDDDV